MITIRRPGDRGHFDHGWLDTYHTFSFADYHDPAYMGFRSLRVINEDRVQAGRGFGTHAHHDMEILTWVLEGALAHRDSMGNGSVIRPGEAQRMSAGSGVTHSEMNGSATEPVHFYQIWIVPERRGIDPGYEQKAFADDVRRDTLRVIASRDGREGSVTIHQDAAVYSAILTGTTELRHAFAPGRFGWLQVARGEVALGGHALPVSTGVAIQSESEIAISGTGEVLLFDLA